MSKSSDLARAIQHLVGRGPQPGLYSVADELIQQAPTEAMRPQQWEEYLKPGRKYEPTPGAQAFLKKQELDETGLSARLNELQTKFPDSPVSIEELREMLYGMRPEMSRSLGLGHTAEGVSGIVDSPTPRSIQNTPRTTFTGPRYKDKQFYHQSPGSTLVENTTRVKDLAYYSHFGDDVLSWSRATVHDMQPTKYGTPLADPPKVRLVEEIQSDLHSAAAKRGMRDPATGRWFNSNGEATHVGVDAVSLEPARRGYLDKYELADAQMRLEELLSLKHQISTDMMRPITLGELSGLDEQVGQLEKAIDEMSNRPPEAPFSDPKEYARLELSKQLLSAADEGQEYLALTRGEDQIKRYGGRGPDARRARGMEHMYDEIYPSVMRKLAKRFGANVVDVELPIGTQADIRLGVFDDMGAENMEDARGMTMSLMNEGYLDDIDLGINTIDEMVTELDERLKASGTPDEYFLDLITKARDHLKFVTESYASLGAKILELDLGGTARRDIDDRLGGEVTWDLYMAPFSDTQSSVDMLWSYLNDVWDHISANEATTRADKTFPAIHLTPEVRELIKKAGVPLYGAAPLLLMMGDEEPEGLARGGPVRMAKGGKATLVAELLLKLRGEADEISGAGVEGTGRALSVPDAPEALSNALESVTVEDLKEMLRQIDAGESTNMSRRGFLQSVAATALPIPDPASLLGEALETLPDAAAAVKTVEPAIKASVGWLELHRSIPEEIETMFGRDPDMADMNFDDVAEETFEMMADTSYVFAREDMVLFEAQKEAFSILTDAGLPAEEARRVSEEITGASWPEFLEFDSNNPHHAGAHYKTQLEAPDEVLRMIDLAMGGADLSPGKYDYAEGGRVTFQKGGKAASKAGDKPELNYLRAVMDSLAGAVPFTGDSEGNLNERGQSLSDTLMYMPAGFASQWKTLNQETGESEWRLPPMPLPMEAMSSGMSLDELNQVNEEIMARSFRPGIVDETLAIAGIPGMVMPETFGTPQFAADAEERSQAMRGDIREDMGLDAPEGFIQSASEGLGMMLGQMPVPGAAFKSAKDTVGRLAGPLTQLAGLLPSAVRTTGRIAGKTLGTIPEFLFPTVEPKLGNYLGGAGFAGVLGSLLGGSEDEETVRLEALQQEQAKQDLFESLTPEQQMELLDKLYEAGLLDVELEDAL